MWLFCYWLMICKGAGAVKRSHIPWVKITHVDHGSCVGDEAVEGGLADETAAPGHNSVNGRWGEQSPVKEDGSSWTKVPTEWHPKSKGNQSYKTWWRLRCISRHCQVRLLQNFMTLVSLVFLKLIPYQTFSVVR